MIINYGAFVSPTLDKNYLPLTLKYLELYALTYGLDDILSELSANTNKEFVKSGTGRSFRLRLESESVDSNLDEIVEIDNMEILNGDFLEATDIRGPGARPANNPYGSRDSGTSKSTRTAPRQPRPIASPNTSARDEKSKNGTDTGQLDRGVVSIEPTWIKVTYGDNVFIFGVKVLPVYIKNDNVILKDLMSDSKNNIISLLTKGLTRSLRRLGSKMYGSTIGKLPLLGNDPPKGINVTKQIIIGTSTMKRNVYLVLNKNNIDPSFIEDTKSLSDMQSYLGWCSMVFADDVNQQVSFCMKINHGMCSLVPYRVLMQSTSKTMTGAYNDIDEIQNAVTSVFKMKKQKITKLLGEMKVASSMIGIQQYLSESLLSENTIKYLKNPDLAIDMFKKIRFIAKNSEIEDVRKKMSNFPFESLETILPYINKNSKNFDKLYKFTFKVFKNSLENVNEKDIAVAATILTYRNSNMRGINQIQRLRQAVKEYIVLYRKNIRQVENLKLAMFRTTVDIFNSNTSILKYNDLGDDTERQEVILRNMYVFLSLVPLLLIESEGD